MVRGEAMVRTSLAAARTLAMSNPGNWHYRSARPALTLGSSLHARLAICLENP
jgi:hypothetical protein